MKLLYFFFNLLILVIYTIPTIINYFMLWKTFNLFNNIYPLLVDSNLRYSLIMQVNNNKDSFYIKLNRSKMLLVFKNDISVSEIAGILERRINNSIYLLEKMPIWDSSIRKDYWDLIEMHKEVEPYLDDNSFFVNIV